MDWQGGITMKRTNKKRALQASWTGLFADIILSSLKLFAGIFGHSAAMLSDAVHSLSDVFSALIVIASVIISDKKADKEHPYGHERFECVAALLLAFILASIAARIGWEGLKTILRGNLKEIVVPGTIALFVALLSILVKEGLFWYKRTIAKKINSSILMAAAWHHRSDALSSVGSFLGILGARKGFPILDPLAAIIIALFIVKVAAKIFIDAINRMVDRACDDKTLAKIKTLILAQKDVEGIDLLKTRLFGNKIYIDVDISIKGEISVWEGHEIAHGVKESLKKELPNLKHCMVHINPLQYADDPSSY